MCHSVSHDLQIPSQKPAESASLLPLIRTGDSFPFVLFSMAGEKRTKAGIPSPSKRAERVAAGRELLQCCELRHSRVRNVCCLAAVCNSARVPQFAQNPLRCPGLPVGFGRQIRLRPPSWQQIRTRLIGRLIPGWPGVESREGAKLGRILSLPAFRESRSFRISGLI